MMRQFLQSWWHFLPRSERFFLFFIGLVAGVAIPLSVNAAKTPVSLLPRAAGSGNGINRPPQLPNQTLHCEQDQPCTTKIRAFDPDAADRLKLTLEFLPHEMALSLCEDQVSLGGRLTHICHLEGIVSKAGEYKFLGEVTDSPGNQTQQILTLVVK